MFDRDCSICYDKTFSENPIIKCKICELPVHVCCYGIEEKNVVDFTCAPCTHHMDSKSIFCILCNKTGGAMKPTTNNEWVHVICVFFQDGAEFMNVHTTMQPVDLSKVGPLKRKIECCFCNEKTNTFKCAKRGCKKGLHPSCGLDNGTIEEREVGKDALRFFGYCSLGHINSKHKRLSSDNVKLVLTNRSKKQSLQQAARENSDWVFQKVNDSHNNDKDNDENDVLQLSVTHQSHAEKTDDISEPDVSVESVEKSETEELSVEHQSRTEKRDAFSEPAISVKVVEKSQTDEVLFELNDDTHEEQNDDYEKDNIIHEVLFLYAIF